MATLSDANGDLTVTANGATLTGNGTTSLTIAGSLTQVDAALASLSDTDATAGADTITLNASDSFGNAAAQQTIGVTVNGLPSLAVPGAQVAGVGKALAVTGIALSETGSTGSPETFTATLADTNGDLTVTANGATLTGNGTTSLTIAGSLTQVDAALASLSDTDTTAGTDTITLNASDSFGNAAAQQTIGVTVNGSPLLTVPGAQTLPSGVATAISGVTLTESGSTGSPESFTATLSDTNGKLTVTANGANLTGNGTTSVTIAGSLTQVDAALASLTDTDATVGADTITLNAGDSFGNTAAQQTIAVSVGGTRSISVPGAQVVGVGKAAAIPSVSLSPSNTVANETFAVTLSDTTGDLKVTANGATLTGNGTTSLTITGSLTQVDAALASLSDTDATAGTDTITLNASDSLGVTATPQTIGVTVNGLPTIAVPAAQVAGVGKALSIAGVTVSETGSTGAPESFTATVSDQSGDLTVTANGATLTGNGTTSVKISGLLTQVDAALASLSDTDATAGADTITVNASDSFGNVATHKTIGVTVNGLPSIAVPGAQIAGVGKALAITGIIVSESGKTVSPERFTATLADTNGKLTVTANGATLTGNGTASLTIAGSLTQVDAALASLKDTDTTTGADTITLNASDSLGNSAAPASIAVTVNGLPSIAVPGAQIAGVGRALAIAGISVSESGTPGSPETFTATVADTNGDLTFTANGATLTDNGTTSVKISGSLTQVDAALASLSDTDATAGADTITVNASDSFGNVATHKTIAVTIDGLPVLTVPGAQTLPSGVATAIAGVSLTESGKTGSPETFTAMLADTNGKLAVTAHGATLTGNGTKSLSISGSLTQVDAALASLKDTDATTGADTITLTAGDSFGNSAAPASIAVTVTPPAAMGLNASLDHRPASAAFNPERLLLSRDGGARGFVTIGDGADHLAATLQLLNQYANQFGVGATDYSFASDKAWGMPGRDFDFEHAGNLESRHCKFAV
jgi:hypothetical protein